MKTLSLITSVICLGAVFSFIELYPKVNETPIHICAIILSGTIFATGNLLILILKELDECCKK